MHIDGLIENTFRNSKLKRVRVKVDPSQLVTRGYENICSFEGYVLEECGTTVQVYLLNVPQGVDNIQTVDKKFITPVQAATKNPSFSNFKLQILKQLQHDGLQTDAPIFQQIQSCTSPDFMDAYLKSAGYDGDKLANLYKKMFLQEASFTDMVTKTAAGLKGTSFTDMATKTAAGLKGIVDNPLYKIADVATRAVAGLPGLVVGKNNVIGRLAKFMKSFDVNDLINVDKYNIQLKDVQEPNVGDSVYIKGLDLPIPLRKFGTMSYQIRGVFGAATVKERKKHNSVQDMFPMELRRQLAVNLDYAILHNPEKIGMLSIDFMDNKYPSRYYKVKVDDFKNNLIISAIERIDERDVSISRRLMQDEVLLVVSKSLNEYLGDRKLSDFDHVLSVVSDNILQNKEKKLQTFDDVMSKLIADKSAMASTNPDMYVKKYLGSAGLYTK